ncbi:MAG: hypothetical protein J6Y99_10200 [Bacteroidales bacterium]|nr:hypothetical protein [Bacteroidales bacterium]
MRKIYLEHANTISYNKSRDVAQDRQVLRGDVLFRQDSIWMSCDSAYFYQHLNSFKAFSHVHLWEGDTLQMWCDSLSYDGEAMVGELFDHVVMHHNDMQLHTEYLHYDRQSGIAHYPEGGWIVNPENHLLSDLGWYYVQERLAVFRDDVEMRNYDFAKVNPRPTYPDIESPLYQPQFVLYSDTLRYSFFTHVARISGPSRVVNDSVTLYTDLGTINTENKQSWLYDRSKAVSRGRSVTADTLFYDGTAGIGHAWGNFVAFDTLQHMSVLGDYCQYVDSPQVMIVTQRALAKEFSMNDTLFLHADTLKSYTAYRHRMQSNPLYNPADSLCEEPAFVPVLDTIHYVTCHYNVRYYRSDIQGVCDSLNYNHKDSLLTFVGNPVMWNESYQITGDTIFAYQAHEGGLSRALVHNNAFLTMKHDTIHYDQISGNGLICYFDSAQLKRMDLSGNVQTIFYPEESSKNRNEKILIGLNQVIGNYLSIWFKDRKMDHLKIWPQPIGSLTPLPLVTDDILYLEGFRWMEYLRPTDPLDVFRDIRMKAEDQKEVIRLFDENELNGW